MNPPNTKDAAVPPERRYPPSASPVQCITPTVFTVRLKIYSDGHHDYTLVENDFTAFAYEQGTRRRIRLTVSNGQISAELPTSKKYCIEG